MGDGLPYGRQWIDDDDIAEVSSVLRSGWLTTGPKVAEFERALAERVGAAFAVVVSSGTAALHLACMAAGIGSGDSVVTSPITFIASANCALYVGARPAFVDIDPATVNMDVSKLEAYLASRRPDERPKAVIPIDFGGCPADLEAISKLAAEYGLIVIEDACHALGASFTDSAGAFHPVGDGAFSDMTIFSFHPVKPITTGEGGAICTNSPDLYERLLTLRNHGMVRDRSKLEKDDGPWYYEMQSLGYNYRLSDIQCALGLSQLRRLDGFIASRRHIAALYDKAFAGNQEIITPVVRPGVDSGYHLYVIQLAGDGPGRRLKVFQALAARGVNAQVHYIPVHLQPYYRRTFGFAPGDFPEAEAYYSRALTLPLFPLMTDDDVAAVVAAVNESLAETR